MSGLFEGVALAKVVLKKCPASCASLCGEIGQVILHDKDLLIVVSIDDVWVVVIEISGVSHCLDNGADSVKGNFSFISLGVIKSVCDAIFTSSTCVCDIKILRLCNS